MAGFFQHRVSGSALGSRFATLSLSDREFRAIGVVAEEVDHLKTETPENRIPERRAFLLSKPWAQAAALVSIVGFFVLIMMGFLTYQSGPPIPGKVVTSSGQVVYTGADVTAGQGVFLKNGLMEFGTIFGQGGYLGPDYTADYLHRAATSVQQAYGGGASSAAVDSTIKDFRTNTYNEATDTLTISDAQATAFNELVQYYSGQFGNPASNTGLRPSAITDQQQIQQVTAYFAWSAWAASTNRPGKEYSYTNNWPGEELVGNVPTGNTVAWSVFSLAALLCGAAVLFAVFGRWQGLGWQSSGRRLLFRKPGSVALTGTQRATAWFFLTAVALFLVQTLVGGLAAHYRADLGSFFGIQLADWLPFNLVRTWHVQLALFWVSTSFLAAGIFLVPMITSKKDRKWQTPLAYLLLGALVIVVVGSLVGELLGQRGAFGSLWSWLGNQGFEYLDLGKLWQILLTVGMILWVIILWRGLRKRLASDSRLNMPWMFFYAALALPAVYSLGLLAQHSDKFAIADFWRFMVVHLWVEDFLELFTTVMVAFMFVLLGVVREKIALRVIFLDIIIFSVGGVIGTAHHWYWTGTPESVLSLGAFFSAMEVIPLLFLSVEAWSFIRVGSSKGTDGSQSFPHRWAVMFLIAVGFWNFLGAGVFGFLINLPIVSYYEVGTALTANHAHAAMLGVYGMLAVGFVVFALRYFIPEKYWSERLMKISFWSLNIGLAWMAFVSLFPLGVLQLYQSVDGGYWSARTMAFNFDSLNNFLEWIRLPGDVLIIAGGVLPLLWMAIKGVRYRGNHQVQPSDEDLQLFILDDEGDLAGAGNPGSGNE